jgi:pentapeptide MXKDX repeat protein
MNDTIQLINTLQLNDNTIQLNDNTIKLPYVIKPRKRKTKEEIDFFLKKIKYQEIDLTCYEKLDVIKEDVIKEDVIKEDVIKEDVIKKDVIKEDVIKEDVIKEDVIKEDILKDIIPYDNEPPLPVNHCCHCYEYIYVGSQLCRKFYCQYEWLDKESLFNMKINNLKICPYYTDTSDEYYELYHKIIHNYLKDSNLLEF